MSGAPAPRADGALTAFAAMPPVLKGVASFFGVFGALSVLLSAMPGVEHRVGGARFDSAGLWEAGLGATGLVLGVWLLACAVGLLRRSLLAAWGVVLAFPLLAGLELAAGGLAGPGRPAAVAAAWALGAWAALFRTPGARAFLRASPDRDP